MRAVILAAGRGHRLSDVVGERPKCLARVGDRTLIERQIRSLRACGIDAVTVVAGYHASDVRRTCGPGVDLITNACHEATNSLYSLWLARDLVRRGFVVLNCDVLFHDQLLRDLLAGRDEDALLMASNRGERYSDEEMKIRARRGCVVDIAKTIEPADADGENVGIAKFGEAGAAVLVAAMHDILAAGGAREWLPRAFAAFAATRPLRIVETRGYPWIEIDSPEDYWRACTEVLPSMTDGEPCMSASTTSASGRSRSAPIPTTSIRAASTPRR